MAQETGNTSEELRKQAVERFVALLESESARGCACAALYGSAYNELSAKRQPKRGSLLQELLDRWSDGFVCERYQTVAFALREPAADVRTNLLLLREPNNNLLGAYGVWLVLAREAQVISPDRDVCIVVPAGAKLTRHHLAWIACINEALGDGNAVRMLVPTWAHGEWKRGFLRGEGYPLADRTDGAVELEHLVDASTGERLALCLTRDGVAEDGRARYLLEFAEGVAAHSGEPSLDDILHEWQPERAALSYGESGNIEHLELDESVGWLVAKFAGEHHLKLFDSWLQEWVVPDSVALFGESGYDRAYYLGQGCWEDMASFDSRLAAYLVSGGYFGEVTRDETLSSRSLHVIGPDGVRRWVDISAPAVLHKAPSRFLEWEEQDRATAQRSEREDYLDKFQGCLVGGAVGDALGYPVEFMSYGSIRSTFGPTGIRSYWLDETGGMALFSDDTQMTLFTTVGLLEAETAARLKGDAKPLEEYVNRAYLDWLHTQDESFGGNPKASHLVDVRPLYAHRAPGNTCLSALHAGGMGTMASPINNSKGCGGVMRVAPVGLFAQSWFGDVRKPEVLREVARAGAAAAALTHGHPMGWIPSGVLSALVALLTYCDDLMLDAAVELCARQLPTWFEDQGSYARDMACQLRQAAELAANDASDYDNVVRLGEGWCGDEALAIAAYCCLRHPDSFDEAVIAAVNHGGDSDSTGAIAGNIMGAYLGIDAIGESWTRHLELRDLIFGLARDLCDGCPMKPGGVWRDPNWICKYGPAMRGC